MNIRYYTDGQATKLMVGLVFGTRTEHDMAHQYVGICN